MPKKGCLPENASASRLLLSGVTFCGLATLIPVYLWLARSTDGSQYFYWYGFQDKRWLVTLYFIWVVGLPLAVLALNLWFRRGVLGQELSTNFPNRASSRTSTVVSRLLVFAVFTGLAWILWGPPWTGRSMHGGVDMHEAVHLKGYQAVLTGSQPYIGAGSEQYGPLSQLLVIGWIRDVSGISISGIREAYAATNFTAIIFIIAILVVFLRLKVAVAAVLLGVFLVPQFTFFTQTANGMAGFFGWASLWRYAGILFLGLAIPWALTRQRTRKSLIWIGVFFGWIWGATTLLAQENLLGGVLVLAIVGIAAALSGRATVRLVGVLIASTLVGMLSVWIIYLTPYFLTGSVSGFLTNYFLFPSAVSSGFTGSTWPSESPWTGFFILVPVLLMLGGVTLALGSISDRYSGENGTANRAVERSAWLTAIGLFAAAAVAQASVLNRSDNSHLFNSSWLFPFFLVAFLAWARQTSNRSMRSREAFVSVAMVSTWLIVMAIGTDRVIPFVPAVQKFWVALESRFSEEAAAPDIVASRLDAPLDPSSPALGIGDGVSRLDAQRFAAEIKAFAGERPTYVDYSVSGSFGALTTGYWYFAADLKPVEIPFEEDHMVITDRERFKNLEALQDPDNPVSVLVTNNAESDQSKAILSRGDLALAGTVDLNGAQIQVFTSESIE